MPLFLHPKIIVATKNDEDLYHHLISFINSSGANSAILASGISFTLLMIQSFMVNYLVNEYRMTTRETFLPAMAYLLITSLLPEWNYLSSPLVANTLIIWAFIKLFKLYNLSITRAEVYNIGVIIGISSYIYFPSASFIICFLLGIMILMPFRPNEIVLFLMGALTPYYFYGAYLFLSDKLNIPNFLPHVSVRIPVITSSIYLAAGTILLAVPFLIGGYFVQTHMHKMLIQVRKNWSILLLYILLAFFVPFINSYTSFNNWILVAAPFAAFHANAYYYPAKKFLPLFLFVITLGFIFFQQYGTKLWFY
jgi:hypothetical protein